MGSEGLDLSLPGWLCWDGQCLIVPGRPPIESDFELMLVFGKHQPYDPVVVPVFNVDVLFLARPTLTYHIIICTPLYQNYYTSRQQHNTTHINTPISTHSPTTSHLAATWIVDDVVEA